MKEHNNLYNKIAKLRIKIQDHEDKIDILKQKIKGLQEECPHLIWIYSGITDSHIHRRCINCGIEVKTDKRIAN